MPAETERKHKAINDIWRHMPTHEVLELEQGYVPPDNKRDTRIYITFPENYEHVAQITIENENGTYTFDGIKEDKDGDFEELKTLPKYNEKTGELTLSGPTEARARIQQSDSKPDKAIFAVKDYDLDGVGRGGREEFEVYINLDDAKYILENMAENIIFKRRHVIFFEGYKWEVDEYLGKDKGFISIDIEVEDEAEFDTMRKFPSAGEDITDVEELRNQAIAEYGVPEAYKLTL